MTSLSQQIEWLEIDLLDAIDDLMYWRHLALILADKLVEVEQENEAMRKQLGIKPRKDQKRSNQ